METVMVRRKLVNAALVAAALLPFGLISCSDDSPMGGGGGTGGSGGSGGKAGSGGAPSDGGKADGPAMDAPAADAGGDRIADTGATLPDGAVPPTGTQILTGGVALIGVTSDNYAVYENNATGTLNVISLAGGMPTAIGTSDDRVTLRGSAIVIWTGTARVTALSVWTAANGVKAIGMTTNAFTNTVAVSPDGSRILYFDGVDAARTNGNLFIAGTDGTGQTQLASQVALNNTSCAPALAFGGNAAAAAAFCIAAPPPVDGGATDVGTTDGGTTDSGTADGGATDGAPMDGAPDGAPGDAGTSDTVSPDGTTDGGSTDAGPTPMAMVQSFRGPSWTATTLATNVDPRVAIDPTGMTVLVSAPTGLVAYPIAGGTAAIIDPGGGFGIFTNDGLSVLYTTPANHLKRATVAAPSPITLATSGFAGFRAKSPDDKWVLGYTMPGARADVGDLYFASTSTPGTPMTLNTDFTAGLFGSDGFTADSSHAIYYTDITSDGVGNFFALSTAGGTPVALSTNVWVHYAALGSKVVFNDNYDSATADIRVVDTAQSAPAKVLVSLAGPDFFIAGSKDRIVYTWDYLAGPMAGLWVTPIP
jgi:hypothetical protein